VCRAQWRSHHLVDRLSDDVTWTFAMFLRDDRARREFFASPNSSGVRQPSVRSRWEKSDFRRKRPRISGRRAGPRAASLRACPPDSVPPLGDYFASGRRACACAQHGLGREEKMNSAVVIAALRAVSPMFRRRP